ncbi:MAG: YbaN family protein [Candidatus Methanomethylophilaceae archaeon]|nr:YbaN family protein [Candidatus Methanomethylophilaceae archaeon]
MNRAKRTALVAAGSVAMVIGGIGVVLPVLPTTPFVIVAALCFSTSSPRMYGWITRNRYFGEYIENYREGKGVSRRTKAYALIFLWSMLIISGIIMRNEIALLVLPVVGAAVSAHILLLKNRAVSCAEQPQ